ncbi:MAG TPA: DUF5668 domain-containing protein [Candidatus Acidoferrales bacterium]|nr:DUF5668 domain-containing protein [Candidatus Acidoferrales bacterium]
MSPYYRRRHGLVGPVVLITIGTIILLDRWWPDFSFHRMWPLILIVIGLVRLLEMGMSSGDGSTYPAPPPPPPSTPTPPGGSQ